jgi:sigma-B regulation protein RsbU (phosphoserine phosphatase)
MAYLLVEVGPLAGQRHSIAAPSVVLGRHPHCDVVIDVGAVSRRHAQIFQEGGDYYIEDLQSRNGTFVNDRLIEGRQSLTDGNVVRICDVELTFHRDSSFTPPEPKPDSTDGSTMATILVDDEMQVPSSTIMSKLDVSSNHHSGIHIAATAEVKLGALLEITRSLGKALALDEVLPQVLNSLFKIFVQADRGIIILKRPGGQLVPRWSQVRREDSDDTIRISRTIVNRVIDSKQAILSADAASDSRFELSESIADFRIRSIMCVPLMDNDGEAFGVLQIDTMDQRQRFQEDDLEVLVSVAGQAAIAITNAQLHEAALRQREMDRDLQIAHSVQTGFLPAHPPQLPDYSFYNYYRPANRVGGDYFDYVEMPDGRLAVVVADVVGHGVAAALLMAKLSAEVRFSLATQLRPESAITRLNQLFGGGLLEDRFVTLVMTVLNPETHELTVVNAGHMCPMVRRASGEIEEVGDKTAGLPVGVVDDYKYEQCRVSLGPGDMTALYTDGINESMNRDGKMYTIDRLRQQVARTAENAEVLGKNIIDDVRQFIDGHVQGDDMCLVSFGRDWPTPKNEHAGATSIM